MRQRTIIFVLDVLSLDQPLILELLLNELTIYIYIRNNAVIII
jgi:hypothetical protein